MASRYFSEARFGLRCRRVGALWLLLLGGSGLGAGCGATRSVGMMAPASRTSRQWLVKPHQREYLADRIMRFDGAGLERAADNHVLLTREGAVGGGGTVGGGCGCN